MKVILVGVGLIVWALGAACAQAEPKGQWDSIATLLPQLSVHYVGWGLGEPKEIFGQWLPPGLGDHLQTRVEVIPLSDSAQMQIDTASTRPAYLLCLYSGRDSSALVLLERMGGGWLSHWRSCTCAGPASIQLRDLNLDRQPEIIVSCNAGPHVPISDFVWQWTNDSLRNITPGGCSNVSQLSGTGVAYHLADSGTVIECSFRFREVGSPRTYFLPKGGSVIRLVKKEAAGR